MTKLDQFAEKLGVKAAIIATGIPLKEGEKRISQIIAAIEEEIKEAGLSKQSVSVEEKRLFVEALTKEGLPISTETFLAGIFGEGNKKLQLNHKQAICLWLGLFRDASFGLAGIWRIWLDLDGPSTLLPNVIKEVFYPQGNEGEDQHFINACIFYFNTYLLTGSLTYNKVAQPAQAIAFGRLWERLAVNEQETLSISSEEVNAVASLIDCLIKVQTFLTLSETDQLLLKIWATRLQKITASGGNLQKGEIEELTYLLNHLRMPTVGGQKFSDPETKREPVSDRNTSDLIAWILQTQPLRNSEFIERTTKTSIHKALKKESGNINVTLSRGHDTLLNSLISQIKTDINEYGAERNHE